MTDVVPWPLVVYPTHDLSVIEISEDAVSQSSCPGVGGPVSLATGLLFHKGRG
jgi:hypothetical protein